MLRQNFEVNPIRNIGWHMRQLESQKKTRVKTAGELEFLKAMLDKMGIKYQVSNWNGYFMWKIDIIS